MLAACALEARAECTNMQDSNYVSDIDYKPLIVDNKVPSEVSGTEDNTDLGAREAHENNLITSHSLGREECDLSSSFNSCDELCVNLLEELYTENEQEHGTDLQSLDQETEIHKLEQEAILKFENREGPNTHILEEVNSQVLDQEPGENGTLLQTEINVLGRKEKITDYFKKNHGLNNDGEEGWLKTLLGGTRSYYHSDKGTLNQRLLSGYKSGILWDKITDLEDKKRCELPADTTQKTEMVFKTYQKNLSSLEPMSLLYTRIWTQLG